MPDTIPEIIQKYIDGKYAQLWDIITNHRHLGYDQTRALDTGRILLQDASTINTNCRLGSHFYCTLGGNRTLGKPTGMRDGQRLIFELIQDGTGSRTITLDASFKNGPWTITLTTTASKRDFIECVYSSVDDKFYITNFQKGY